MRRTELEMLREELAHANATNASQRDDLNNSEDRNRDLREEINKARAAKHAAEAERVNVSPGFATANAGGFGPRS